MAARRIRYEYDGGIIYLTGECGLCLHPFSVSTAQINAQDSLAQRCININGCPSCVRRVFNTPASKHLSVRTFYLSRHCASLACGKLFRVSGLPHSGGGIHELCFVASNYDCFDIICNNALC